MAGAASSVLCLLLAAAVSAYAVQHKVGDADGWSGGVDYEEWADGRTFVVGDTLLFEYSYPIHAVTEVNEADYEECSDANYIKSYTNDRTVIALDKPGTRYFICPTPGHCPGGIKVAVTVTDPTAKKKPASAPAANDGTTSANASTMDAAKAPAANGAPAVVRGGSLGFVFAVASIVGLGLMG